MAENTQNMYSWAVTMFKKPLYEWQYIFYFDTRKMKAKQILKKDKIFFLKKGGVGCPT